MSKLNKYIISFLSFIVAIPNAFAIYRRYAE